MGWSGCSQELPLATPYTEPLSPCPGGAETPPNFTPASSRAVGDAGGDAAEVLRGSFSLNFPQNLPPQGRKSLSNQQKQEAELPQPPFLSHPRLPRDPSPEPGSRGQPQPRSPARVNGGAASPLAADAAAAEPGGL